MGVDSPTQFTWNLAKTYLSMTSAKLLCFALFVVAPCLGAWPNAARQEDCPQNYVKIHSNCYFFSNEKVTYDEAQKKGNLVTDNARINEEIIDHLIEINQMLSGPDRRVYWINSYWGKYLALGPDKNGEPDEGLPITPNRPDLEYFVGTPNKWVANYDRINTKLNYILRK